MADSKQPNPPGKLRGQENSPVQKKKAGRPVGSTTSKRRKFDTPAERFEYEANQKEDIVARQRHDCQELAKAIKAARPGAHSPADIQKLVNSTATLHGLEREAHDFGAKGQAVQAVMMIPVPAETMAQWDILAKAILPATEAPKGIIQVNPNVSYEDDVIGEPEPTDGETE